MSEAENLQVYGKCNNPHGHGHNYALEITLAGPVDEGTGMVCNLAELDAFVTQEIMAIFDHSNLNTLSAFSASIPSTENLCREIYDIVQKGFRSAKLDKIRIEETSKNSFEYAGGAEVRK